MSDRGAILGRVRAAVLGRSAVEHPGAFEGRRPAGSQTPPVEAFTSRFVAAGGEVVRHATDAAGADWLAAFAASFEGVTTGAGVPAALRPPLPELPAVEAPLGVSMARGAVAETGSLVLDARDGRRSQLLAPNHVVLVRARDVHSTLRAALVALGDDLTSATGLHSGPSKSSDLGQIVVRGVHGPGAIVAVVLDEDAPSSGSS
jgi:L-lactate dehydrogenase complex protein LldG